MRNLISVPLHGNEKVRIGTLFNKHGWKAQNYKLNLQKFRRGKMLNFSIAKMKKFMMIFN